MASLQKVALGTPPSAVDGDTVRVANTKANANVDVLNTQVALTSAAGITAAQALTVAHVGKRVNIALAQAGVINLPAASTCAADNVILLRNIGTTVVTLAITGGSADTVGLSRLNPGESALMDTDGIHGWTVLMRGRTNSDNEIVNGNCTVNGNEVINGALSTVGVSTLLGGVSVGNAAQATISAAGAYTGASAAYSGSISAGGNAAVTGTLSVGGLSTLGSARIGTASAFDTGVLYASNNQSSVGSVPAASITCGTAGGPRLWMVPNTGAGFFNPIVGANDVALVPNNGSGSGVNLSICPPGSAAGGLRLTADGNVSFSVSTIAGLYNGTAPSDGAGLGADHGLYVQRKAGACIWVSKNGSVSGSWDPAYVQFYNQGSQIGSISTPAGSSISYNTTSDYRIKTVVRPASGVLDRVCAIPVYRGYYTADGPESEHEIALAHEIAEQFPAVVTGEKDAVSIHPVFWEDYDPEDVQPGDVLGLREAIVPQQVDYSRLVVPLISAVKELRAQLDAATARIAALGG
ncbi:hypothetical protein EN871_16845 [bacterium M00.F.Ca.ET.228.01.1.1]|nr:hypothetical protein EN871_16845 [bacterium M00.F.Ca.ET.228.01.1.1]TGS00914.1 hypothetical protein EN834_16840 [bacterium M00.F.Ca.ET.191.01.1.1]TGU05299.1 hypothetical protein EN798_17660 [bacterium M00.F.Ca.ET.155.01.1.1]